MTTSKEHLEIALGGNMHTSSLTTLAIEEIMTDFARQNHKEQLILSGVVFSEAELKAKLEEQLEGIRQWLIGEDFEGLAERL